MWATRKNGSIDSFNLFYVNRKWKGLATLHTQLYRRLHGRQTRIFRFSSAQRGGKLAIAALPPFSSAVNLTFQFSSARRKGKLEIAALPPFSSAVNSTFQSSSARRDGKLEIGALPPLPSAVNLTFQFSSAQRGGKLAIAALPPLPSAVKSIFQFSSALRGGKLETALMLRVHVSEIFQSDFLILFSLLLLLVGPWAGA